MNIQNIINRRVPPVAWEEADKIPWNDPEFSQRMLEEHLTQQHDAASRRFSKIDEQVAWIHKGLLHSSPSCVLDLGCGPGLYSARLARLGHECLGIDYSPASIAYARGVAEREGLPCRFIEGDLRTTDFGTAHSLAMLIYGEFNTFRAESGRQILGRMFDALAPGGTLLLEPHTYAAVQQEGEAPQSWNVSQGGLLCPGPHVVMNEAFWDAERGTSVWRSYVIDAESADVIEYSVSMQAYTDAEYVALLESVGCVDVRILPNLTGDDDRSQPLLCAVVGTKPA